MHYSSHSTGSVHQDYAKENENTDLGDVGAAMAHYKQRQGHQAPFQQHRVALSDVTSQVSNRIYATNTANASTKPVADLTAGPTSMSRNETYVTVDDWANKQRNSDPSDCELYVEDSKKTGLTGQEEELGNDAGEEEEEGAESDDEVGTEPLLPVHDEKSKAILDQAYKECHRETPDPMDDDTYDVVMVSELSTEIFEYLRQLEIKYRPNPYYMDKQPELKWSYRSTLIDWIIQVHSRFQLLPETLYLTVNIIDRFLSRKTVTLNRFQLVGAAALFVAAKYEEINCPTLNDIIYMLDHAYTKEDIVKAEKFMIDTLDFEIGWPGPFSFLRRISKADDYEYDTRTLAKYLLETTTMDSKLVAAPPSWLATGAYFLSRIILGCNEWTFRHIYYSGYTQEQIFPLATVILENCRFAERRHQAIWKKYSERRQHRSAQVVAKWIALAERKIDQSSI